MVLVVVLDVTLEVEAKPTPGRGIFVGQPQDQSAEHVGDDVFAAVGEGGSDRGGGARLDHRERPPHEGRGGRRAATGVERRVEAGATAKQVEQPLDRACVGAGLPHGVEVEFEVRRRATLGKRVRLLVEHDLVDEPAGLGIGCGQPGNARASQTLLERLEQALEVPNREHVTFHEPPQPLRAVDQPIDAVRDEPVAEVTDVDRRPRGDDVAGR